VTIQLKIVVKICVGQGSATAALRRRLQQAGGTELVLRISVDWKPIG